MKSIKGTVSRSSRSSCSSFKRKTKNNHTDLRPMRLFTKLEPFHFLQLCFAVKLRKCYVNFKTSSNFPSAGGGGDSARMFTFW